MDSYERFTNFVDGFILILIIIVSAIVALAMLNRLHDYIKCRKKRKALMKLKNAQSAVVLDQDNEFLNKHIKALNQCSTDINKFLETYNRTHLNSEHTFSRLDKVSDKIVDSAESIENSLKRVEYRDQELQKEIAALRFAETVSDPESYLKSSIEFLDITKNGRNSLQALLHCHTINDVLEAMIKYQRKGLMRFRNIGRITIEKLEKAFAERGIIAIHDGKYFSNLKPEEMNG